jgi:hypothetical protein
MITELINRLNHTLDLDLRADNYIGMLRKQLTNSSSIGHSRQGSGHGYHIEVTGAAGPMQFFPLVTSSKYLESRERDEKRRYYARINVKLSRSNFEALIQRAIDTDLTIYSEPPTFFEMCRHTLSEGSTETFTHVTFNKRSTGQMQLEIGYGQEDDSLFTSFRKVLLPGDTLIFLQINAQDYEVIGVPQGEVNFDDIPEYEIARMNTSIQAYSHINATPDQNTIRAPEVPFELDRFVDDLALTNLRFPRKLLIRFVGSLLSKRFLILTGLSGSGKTKIAEAFALWINSGKNGIKFTVGQEIHGARSVYTIEDADRLGVLIRQEGSDTKTFLPHGLLQNWADVIREKEFDSNTPSQEIQAEVLSKGIEYSPTLNSFHSPLKALALYSLQAQQSDTVEIDQYCLIAVGADWTNREPLLGFPNALVKGEYVKPDNGALDLILNAEKNSTRPYFLILDEMNMSHVERYFADFLSGMEATNGKIELHPEGDDWQNCDVPASIKLPNNLFIIGTVNIDETTYMFSPKVLDRANVIEFRVTDQEMNAFLDAPSSPNVPSIEGKGMSMGQDFVLKALKKVDTTADLKDALLPFFQNLQNAGAEFGYRTASEMSRFISVCTELAEGHMSADEIIDAGIMQKLLPKLHGSRNKLENILMTLGRLCLVDQEKLAFQEGEIGEDIKYPLSYEKLNRMYKRVRDDGFTSYAEA